ncbi:MAG: AraC family transcriptional regulator [Pedobacter sp.]|uniref:helix-turn-helix domain-containing protein n=1 Tax=Pedobacter sp. TaxID=1411316 RepID=UPI003568571F
MATRKINKYAEIVFTCNEAVQHSTELIAEEHAIVRVLSGELKVVQAHQIYVFGADETHLLPRNRPARLIKSEKDGNPYKAIVIKLTNDVLRAFYEDKNREVSLNSKTYTIIPLPKSLLLDSLFASMLPYFDLNYKLPADLSKIKIQEAITVLRSVNKDIDNILSDFSEPHKINIAAFMEKNYMYNMPMEKFAYLTGRSLSTYKRDFKKAFNTTPQKWLTAKRLELAHYQLTEKHKKPIDVFYEVGFENLSHFSNAFKKHYGHPPTAAALKNK